MRYCITIDEQNRQRSYGIDLIGYDNGEHTILMSKPNITDDWRCIRKIARYANIIGVPPNLFEAFLGVVVE